MSSESSNTKLSHSKVISPLCRYAVLQHCSMLGQCLVRYCYGFLQLPLCNTSNELKNKVWKRSFPHIFKLNDAFAN